MKLSPDSVAALAAAIKPLDTERVRDALGLDTREGSDIMDTLTTKLDCGHEPTRDAGIGTGYGRDADGRMFCYACCTRHDLDAVAAAKPGDRVTFYVGSDGDAPSLITNWPGDVIMCKVRWGNVHNWSRWANEPRHYITAVDADGWIWSGTGAPGMWASLRKTRQRVESGPAALAKGDPRTKGTRLPRSGSYPR